MFQLPSYHFILALLEIKQALGIRFIVCFLEFQLNFLLAILIAMSPKNPLYWDTVSKCEPQEKHFNETISTARKQW